MQLEQYKFYRAKINWHRTDDLAEYAPDNNEEVLVHALWIADEDEKFNGDWMLQMSRYLGLIPERDLEIIKEITIEEFEEDRKLGIIKNI